MILKDGSILTEPLLEIFYENVESRAKKYSKDNKTK
jgi:hypothetical protein